MSESATLEATPSEATLTPSDDNALPASTEEQAPIAAESPEPSAEPVTPEAASPPAPRSIAEIRAAIADPNGSATGAELQQLQRYEQSARDVQANIERRRGEHQTAVKAAESLALSAVEMELAAASARDREPDLDLIKQKLETVFSSLGPKAEVAALSSYDARLDAMILEFAGGDVSYMRELTQGKDFANKMDVALSQAYAMGQREGAPAGSVVLTQAELDAKIQAAVNASRAANPARGASVGGGNPSTSSRSDAELLADPTTPIAKLQEIRTRQRAS